MLIELPEALVNESGTTIKEITGLTFEDVWDEIHTCMRDGKPLAEFLARLKQDLVSGELVVSMALLLIVGMITEENNGIPNSAGLEAQGGDILERDQEALQSDP